MTLHLKKLAAGVESVEHLAEIHAQRLEHARRTLGRAVLYSYTRNHPRRGAEIAGKGSLYWVIKGVVRVRQPVLGLERDTDEDGRSFTRILLDPGYVPVVARPHKAFQGWRYLDAADAPADLDGAGGAEGELPAQLAAELRGLGLL